MPFFSIASNYGAGESIERLQRALSSSTDASLRGNVSEYSVRLQRARRLSDSIFRPEFHGSFVTSPSGCQLEGEFRFSDQAKAVIWTWIACVAVLIGGSSVVGLRAGWSDWWRVPLGGLLILLGGMLFFVNAQLYYWRDRDWIIQRVSSALAP
jgi:hypothetical protein